MTQELDTKTPTAQTVKRPEPFEADSPVNVRQLLISQGSSALQTIKKHITGERSSAVFKEAWQAIENGEVSKGSMSTQTALARLNIFAFLCKCLTT